jgi:hypothetical protein
MIAAFRLPLWYVDRQETLERLGQAQLMDVNRYLADISGIQPDHLLEDWQWLLGEVRYKVFRATAMGDLIIQDQGGLFYFLDMLKGKLRPLASSEEELWTKLTDRRLRKFLLSTFTVRDLQQEGCTLAPGQCYSPKHPPILGGDPDKENLERCDIQVHASIMGQLHRQVKNLAPGTKISDIVINAPKGQ